MACLAKMGDICSVLPPEKCSPYYKRQHAHVGLVNAGSVITELYLAAWLVFFYVFIGKSFLGESSRKERKRTVYRDRLIHFLPGYKWTEAGSREGCWPIKSQIAWAETWWPLDWITRPLMQSHLTTRHQTIACASLNDCLLHARTWFSATRFCCT